MVNPFKFGGLVTGKDFADRESEMAELLREVRDGINILLFFSRRMGKSSLLAEMMGRHGKELIWVYVDMYGITTKCWIRREASPASDRNMKAWRLSQLIRSLAASG